MSEDLETLLQTAREQSESGLGLPKYVEKEFREYLRCGVPCYGFTKLQCQTRGKTLFLSFSCKRRGFCSSCGARRMCTTAAVAVDRVVPEVPVRQWVLSTPFELRLLLARKAEAFGELTRVFSEEVLAQYRRRAAKLGLAKCEGGALAFQHRFGGNLNLNTHLHAVLVDGVFEMASAHDSSKRAKLQPLLPPQPVELTSVAYDVYRKFEVWLKKKGLMRLAEAEETYENEDALASCLRGSLGIGQVVELDVAGDVQCSQEHSDEHRFALRKSPQAGEFGGFSIHAGVTVHAADKDGRERLIRYCARIWSCFRRCNTAPLRAVGASRVAQAGRERGAEPMENRLGYSVQMTYDLDALRCPRGGRRKAVELVTDAPRAKELLEQFGMSTKPPPIARARSPDWD